MKLLFSFCGQSSKIKTYNSKKTHKEKKKRRKTGKHLLQTVHIRRGKKERKQYKMEKKEK